MFSFTINHHPFVAIFHLNHYRIVGMELPTWVKISLNFKGYTVTPGVAKNFHRSNRRFGDFEAICSSYTPWNKQGTGPNRKQVALQVYPARFLLWEIHASSVKSPHRKCFFPVAFPKRDCYSECHANKFYTSSTGAFTFWMVHDDTCKGVKWKPSHRRAPQKAMKRRPRRVRVSWWTRVP